jgi:hypothetical protein
MSDLTDEEIARVRPDLVLELSYDDDDLRAAITSALCPFGGSDARAARWSKIFYARVRGDTYVAIAKRHHVTPPAIRGTYHSILRKIEQSLRYRTLRGIRISAADYARIEVIGAETEQPMAFVVHLALNALERERQRRNEGNE